MLNCLFHNIMNLVIILTVFVKLGSSSSIISYSINPSIIMTVLFITSNYSFLLPFSSPQENMIESSLIEYINIFTLWETQAHITGHFHWTMEMWQSKKQKNSRSILIEYVMHGTKNALYPTWYCSLQHYVLWYDNGNSYYTHEIRSLDKNW